MSVRISRSVLTALVLLAGLAAGLRAQTDPDPLTSYDVARLQNAVAVAVSPDGEWIAYTVAVPRGAGEANGGGHVELQVVPFAGGPSRTFIAAPGTVGSIGWTPDSRRILFTGRRGEAKQTTLYEIPVDGGEARPLFEPAGSIQSWTMSHDGLRVAYTAAAKESDADAAARKKGFDQIIYQEDTAAVVLRVVDLRDGTQVSVDVPGAPWESGFSPDDTRLAVWVSPTPSIDDSYMKKRLYVCNLASGKAAKVADNPGKVGNFAWSPDGRQIAFVSAVDVHDPRESSLMVVSAAGGPYRALTATDWEGHVDDLVWRDDDAILILASEGTETRVYRQPASGGVPLVVVMADAVWHSFAACAGGNCLALIGDTPRSAREVFAIETPVATTATLVTTTATRVTNLNPWLAAKTMGEQHVVRYPARDGLEVEAVLILPVNYQAGTRYPLIVTVHGGPEAHYSDGWLTAYSMPGQVAANRGYALLYPNYRGSTGRGVKFSKLDQGRMGKEEFDDLVDGVDYLVAQGVVDKARVGITGGSYGGYASAWGATYYSDRFAASVMFVGISEQISKVFTTDIPNESYLVHWRMRPFGNWTKFLEASPIYYIDRAKTPILIAHGQDDPRVSVTQSLTLYNALKVKGDVPVRLVLYPGEGHGNRKAAARLDYSLRQMQWFDHFLKEGGKTAPAYRLSYEEPAQ